MAVPWRGGVAAAGLSCGITSTISIFDTTVFVTILLILAHLLRPAHSHSLAYDNHSSPPTVRGGLDVENEVLSIIEANENTSFNVTINPTRALSGREKIYSNGKFYTDDGDGTLTHVIDAKEFFTSISAKNFTTAVNKSDVSPPLNNLTNVSDDAINSSSVVDVESDSGGDEDIDTVEAKKVLEELAESEREERSDDVVNEDKSKDDVKNEGGGVEKGEEKNVTESLVDDEQGKGNVTKDKGEEVKTVPKNVTEVDEGEFSEQSSNVTETKEVDDMKQELNVTESNSEEEEEEASEPTQPKPHDSGNTTEEVVEVPEEEKGGLKPDKKEVEEDAGDDRQEAKEEGTSQKKKKKDKDGQNEERESADIKEKEDKEKPDKDGKSEEKETEDASAESEEQKIEKDAESEKSSEDEDKEKTKVTDVKKEGKKKKEEPGETDPDTLETYSQFTQRVNAAKKNDATNGHGTNGHSKGPKVKSKNYASPDCGSKLLTANPEATHASKVIQSNKDEYMLNKCRDKIWFIIELCESIRPQKFDIANFELFSNLPKDIQVLGSHRYPTRDWTGLGRFTGQEGNRAVQSYPIETEDFFKYIKVEVLSHYGSEFFCPISLFRIYGLSEFEVIDSIEDSPDDSDDNEEQFMDSAEEEQMEKKTKDDGKPSVIFPTVLKYMFSGVLDVIKRGYRPISSRQDPDENCYSLHPKFTVEGGMCSMASSLNYILSCYQAEYEVLMQQTFVSSTVKNSSFCHRLASIMCQEPEVNDSVVYDTLCNNSYVCVMLSPKHVLAMCFMHDPNIFESQVACDEDGTHLPENFSASSSDLLPTADDVPAYVKSAVINTSSITRTDAADSNFSSSTDVQGVTVATADEDQRQVLLEQDIGKANETAAAEAPESQAKETPKSHKDSKASGSKTPDKPVKEEVDVNATEPEDEGEIEGSGIGVDLDVDFPSPEENATSSPPSHPAPPPPPVESKVSSSSNKESVVVRLSNKIKALEYNMSISSQYLEELSRRYKRQMEEMQRQFNLTIAALNATSWQAYERDQQHQQDIEALEEHLANVSNILMKMVNEQDSLARTVVEQHLLLMLIEVVVLCIVFTICTRRSQQYSRAQETRETPSEEFSSSIMQQENHSPGSDGDGRSRVRRRSVDSITRERASRPRQRRPSEEALNISGTYQDLLIIEPAIPIMVDSVSEQRKKKKKSSSGTLKRSKSNASISEKSASHSRRLRRIEKLNVSSAGVLFCGDINVCKSPSPSTNDSVFVNDIDTSGQKVNSQSNEGKNALDHTEYDFIDGRPFVMDLNPEENVLDTSKPLPSKRHSIACCQNCDNVDRKGAKLSKSFSVCSASERCKNVREKVKKGKKLKKVKSSEVGNQYDSFLHAEIPIPASRYEHDYYQNKPNGIPYSYHHETYGDYIYGHNSVHFSEDTKSNGHYDSNYCYSPDFSSTDHRVNGVDSHINDQFIAEDFKGFHEDSYNMLEKKKTSPKAKTRVKLRSDNWEWYSTQHLGSSSSETVSTCSDSSGKARRQKPEEKEMGPEDIEDKKGKKKKKSKAKSREPVIPETEVGT